MTESRGKRASRRWDVFISKKGQDLPHAKRVYDYLTQRGFRVFLSEISIRDAGMGDFQEIIEQALEECEHLVVVGSSRENIESGWVKAEWRMFLGELRANRKQGNLLTVLVGDLDVTDLPLALKTYQAIPLSEQGLDALAYFLGSPQSEHNAEDIGELPGASEPAGTRPRTTLVKITAGSDLADRVVRNPSEFGPAMAELIRVALNEVRFMNHERLGPEHLFCALIKQDHQPIARALKAKGHDPRNIRRRIRAFVGKGESSAVMVVRSDPALTPVFQEALTMAQRQDRFISDMDLLAGLSRCRPDSKLMSFFRQIGLDPDHLWQMVTLE